MLRPAPSLPRYRSLVRVARWLFQFQPMGDIQDDRRRYYHTGGNFEYLPSSLDSPSDVAARRAASSHAPPTGQNDLDSPNADFSDCGADIESTAYKPLALRQVAAPDVRSLPSVRSPLPENESC